MLLENELEALSHWFQNEYPDGKISAHAGKNKRTGEEEYNITFSYRGKHFSAPPVVIPPNAQDQDRSFIKKFKADYLEMQKKKIRQTLLLVF